MLTSQTAGVTSITFNMGAPKVGDIFQAMLLKAYARIHVNGTCGWLEAMNDMPHG